MPESYRLEPFVLVGLVLYTNDIQINLTVNVPHPSKRCPHRQLAAACKISLQSKSIHELNPLRM